jgi:hypothetical protein
MAPPVETGERKLNPPITPNGSSRHEQTQQEADRSQAGGNGVTELSEEPAAREEQKHSIPAAVRGQGDGREGPLERFVASPPHRPAAPAEGPGPGATQGKKGQHQNGRTDRQ